MPHSVGPAIPFVQRQLWVKGRPLHPYITLHIVRQIAHPRLHRRQRPTHRPRTDTLRRRKVPVPDTAINGSAGEPRDLAYILNRQEWVDILDRSLVHFPNSPYVDA